MIQQMDILLLPFPFSDLTSNKVRPVLVLSNDLFNNSSDDIIVCAITSKLSKDKYSIYINNKDLEEGNLFTSSSIKVENIVKIDKKLIIKKIGKLKKETFLKVLNKLNKLF